MTAQSTLCAKCGQLSTEPDYCSECGARLAPAGATVAASTTSGAEAPTLTAAPSTSAAGSDLCPTCQTPRPSASARFCEVCRYDFVKGGPGEPPILPSAAPGIGSAPATDPPTVDPSSGASAGSAVASAASATDPTTTPASAPPKAAAPLVPGSKWDVVIAVDAGLDVEPDPALTPPDEPERRIPLDQPENLIGRRNDAQNIVPEVRPHDPGVSRRHAKLLVRPDGSVAILDLDSANGTFVNDQQIVAGVPRELSATDVITLGRWTRLRVEPRSI